MEADDTETSTDKWLPLSTTKREPSDEDLISITRAHVKAYMARYDSSHDFAHIERVLGLALHILSSSAPTSVHPPPTRTLSRTLTTLAALLHDIGDKKYLASGAGTTLARTFLLSIGCDAARAQDVQDIVNAVSYSDEVAHPEVVREVLERLPELGCVQDADRLDAIGAVGVGRAFTYAATVRAGKAGSRELGYKSASASDRTDEDGVGNGEELSSSMEDTMRHFEEKLLRLEWMMKTERGKEMARERTERLRVFKEWWEEEVGFAEV